MNCRDAKERYAIYDYLGAKGYNPVRIIGSGYWYHSLISEDHTPSMVVSHDGRMFKDFSSGKGGTIIDMAMIVVKANDIGVALDDIQQTMSGCSDGMISNRREVDLCHKESSIHILSVAPVTSKLLMGYAYGRGRIRREIVCNYCVELVYENASGIYYALGFKNDKGGYEIRSKPFKGGNSPKAITTINDMADCPFMVFEGFFDFLSAVQLDWFNPDTMNAIVLNSTSMVEQAYGILNNASRILLFLDNDATGRATADAICERFPTAENKSFLFSPAKDLNDFLMNNSKIRRF